MNLDMISRTASDWQKFLSFSANMYSYNFNEQIQLYLKMPTATSAATVAQWNSMGRRVNKGAKGFRISENSFVFDITQTHGTSINKWQFSAEYIPFYYDLLMHTKAASNIINQDGDFSLNIYDFVNEAIQNNDSISGKLSEDIREFTALSITYTVLSRMNMLQNDAIDFNFSEIEGFDNNTIEIIGTVVSLYSNVLLRCAKQTVQTTTQEQIRIRQSENAADSQPIVFDDYEDVHTEDTIWDETSEETHESPENNDNSYTVNPNYTAETEKSDNDDYNTEESTNISETVTINPVTENYETTLSVDKQLELLDEALLLDSDDINKEAISRFYSSFNKKKVIVPYVKNAYHNKYVKTDRTDYPCLSGYIGKKSGLMIKYSVSAEKDEKFIIDWETAARHIRQLINDGKFITNSDDTSIKNNVTSLNQPFDVRMILAWNTDIISTHITESYKSADDVSVYKTYADYKAASKGLTELRYKLEHSSDLSEFYEKIPFRVRDFQRHTNFFLNGEEYTIYELSQLDNFVEIAKKSDIDLSIAYIQRNENNKPSVIRTTYSDFESFYNNPDRFRQDPRLFKYEFPEYAPDLTVNSSKKLTKKEEKELKEYIKGLEESYRKWEQIYENGNTDPFYADGISLGLIRNHIIYYKNNIHEKYPEHINDSEYYDKELPPEVDNNYMALKAGDIIEMPMGRFSVLELSSEASQQEIMVKLQSISDDEILNVPITSIKGTWKRIDSQTQNVNNTEEANISDSQEDESVTVNTVAIPTGVAHRNYIALCKMFPEFMRKEYSYEKLSAGESFDPLSLEWIGENSISMMQFYIQNGDVMRDPDIVLTIDAEHEAVTSFSYENSGLRSYREYDEGSQAQHDCDRFVTDWLRNINGQDYVPVKALDFEGNEIFLDESPVREDSTVLEQTSANERDNLYDIKYGNLGNGLTVWNSAVTDPQTNDFQTIAHIDTHNRLAIKFYVTDMPEKYKNQVLEILKKAEVILDKEALAEANALSFLNIKTNDDGYEVYSEYVYENGEYILRNVKEISSDTQYEERTSDASEREENNIQLTFDDFSNVEESQVNDDIHDESEKVIIPFNIGDEIEYNDRTYTVDKINTDKNEIGLLDNNTGWYPIINIQPLDKVIAYYNKNQSKDIVDIEAIAHKPENFVITDDELGYGGPKNKYKMNVAAIKLLKELEAENRQATAEEQEVLSRYVGWGGVAQAFEEANSSWSDEYAELKRLLTPEEYESAQGSVLNAHYTSPVIIRSMYKALEKFGFRGGKILEPSCGIGNFLGSAPADQSANFDFTGIEIDSISGRIAKQLYPQSNIQICGYEQARLKESSFDVVIGNVPFGNYSVTDKKYNKNNNLIHDYFFLKSLEMVKPNGVVAFITSKGTLDKRSSKVRAAISEKAVLIGAIRLPETAFKQNAGAETVTDIIFLQRRDVPSPERTNWINVNTEEYSGLEINQYFVDNPDMVCGHIKRETSRFGYSLTVKPFENDSLEDDIMRCVDKLSAKIDFKSYSVSEESLENNWELHKKILFADPDMRPNTCTIVDDTIFEKTNGRLEEVNVSSLNAKQVEILKALVNLGTQTRKTIDVQTMSASNEDFEIERLELNRQYDNFQKKYGYVKRIDRVISDIFRKDDNSALVYALETPDENVQGKYIKAQMFYSRTIKPENEITHCDSITDGFFACLNVKADIDLIYISEITDKSVDECIDVLNGTYMFHNPIRARENNKTIGWEPADEYLSGNVREKLELAKVYSKTNSDYSVNVEALEKVQPQRIHACDISCQLGSSWIPPRIISDFIKENFYTINDVEHNELTARWYIHNKMRGNSQQITNTTYGTSDLNALQILENALNLRDSKVYKTVYIDGNEKRVVDKERTSACTIKQDSIKELFKEWVYKDAQRTQLLEDIYNEKYNSERPRTFDGTYMTFPGMTADIKLLPHQKNAVARAVNGGNTLLAHVVGAGKTYEMTAAAMEQRRLGLLKKPLFVVPNHLIGQWSDDFHKLYPAANVLPATTKDFEKEKRKEFTARIATGDYDAIIMGYSTFSMISISPERRARFYQEEIDECMEIINSESDKSLSVKDAQIKRKQLEKKLKSLEYVKDRDSVIYFEQLGVDGLFIDEAHNFKNLSINTKLNRVAGISTSASNRAEDLYMKIRYISEINNGCKGVCFATGTPISNSITEMYIMQKYLQPDYLKSKGHSHFDSWIADFGEITTSIELAPTGTSFRSKTRCSSFKNVPELMMMFKRCTDVQTAEMLHLPIPKLKDNKYTLVITKPSEEQQEYIRECGERADMVHKKLVYPEEDNMLKITNDGKMCALDMRLVNPNAADDPNSKVNVCVRNIYNKYKESEEYKGTQIVFLDRSTPKPNTFNLYDDIRDKLIKMGISKNEIAFIHDAKNDTQKQKMFADVNSGKIRIIFGSTDKMGAGTNIQQKLCALHHVDVPWRPSDIEQREGRILRRGNECAEVEIFRYATEKTFDSYSWQTIENKQKAISQVMTDKPMGRSVDDIDEQALNYAEIKSLATGDERIKEHLEITLEVSKLKSQKAQFEAERIEANRRLTFVYPKELVKSRNLIANYQKDIEVAKNNPKPEAENFRFKIGDTIFKDRHDAGKAIFAAKKNCTESLYIGEYRSFNIFLKKSVFSMDYMIPDFSLVIKNNSTLEISLGKGYEALINSIDDVIDKKLPEMLSLQTMTVNDISKNMDEAKKTVASTFPKENELKAKTERLSELTASLHLDDNSDDKYAGINNDDENEENYNSSRGRR